MLTRTLDLSTESISLVMLCIDTASWLLWCCVAGVPVPTWADIRLHRLDARDNSPAEKREKRSSERDRDEKWCESPRTQ
jgi:hypothetical protein